MLFHQQLCLKHGQALNTFEVQIISEDLQEFITNKKNTLKENFALSDHLNQSILILDSSNIKSTVNLNFAPQNSSLMAFPQKCVSLDTDIIGKENDDYFAGNFI